MNAVDAAALIPTTPGAPFAGGFIAAHYFLGGEPRALIVAGKEHELSGAAWNEALKNVKGALSYSDGMANTLAMEKAGSTLAKDIRALRIGGFDDWHLMSRLEALLAFGELGSEKTFTKGPEAFQRDAYWTSTQSASDSGYAWYQHFNYGHQLSHLKSVQLLARPVRSIKI